MNYTLTIALGGLAVLLLTLELLRRRQLREKYAAIWLFVGLSVLVLSLFPSLLLRASSLLGFAVPANLIFLVAVAVLLFVSMQLSLEVGHLEDESQRLAEELALLRHDLDRLRSEFRLHDQADQIGEDPPSGT